MKTYIFKAKTAPIVLLVVRKNKQFWHLIKWDLEADTFEHGQWLFKKQLYIPGCSLSPDGKLFYWVYNRYQHNYTKTHVGISPIPKFTAIVYGERDTGRWEVARFDKRNGLPINTFGLQGEEMTQLPPLEAGHVSYDLSAIAEDSGLILDNRFEFAGNTFLILDSKVYKNDDIVYDYSHINYV